MIIFLSVRHKHTKVGNRWLLQGGTKLHLPGIELHTSTSKSVPKEETQTQKKSSELVTSTGKSYLH